MRESKDLTIDWSKFKVKAKGGQLTQSKQGYIEFCEILSEVGFELVSDYVKAVEKVKLKCKYSDFTLNVSPIIFKISTYKSISNFKKELLKTGDKLVRFISLTDKNNLIAQIETFDGGIIDLDIGTYIRWNNARQDFYSKLKKVNGYTTDFYINKETKMNICIEHVKLNTINPSNFKRSTYKNIIDFKNKLKENGDEFIKFTKITLGGNLVSQIKTFDDGVVDIDISQYNSFNKSRQDFYNKLKEVNGYTTDFYKDNRTKMNIFIDNIKLNPIIPSNFKRTHKIIIYLKDNIIKNGDKFIKFVGLTTDGSIIAKIKTFDGRVVLKDVNNYNRWSKSRKDTYDYCEKRGYKVLSSYIDNQNKILIDFDCSHEPHWVIPNTLKKGHECPICDESKGEKFIRSYWKTIL